MNNIVKRTLSIVLISIYIPFLWAISETSQSDSLEIDSRIRYGQLPNGFTYYIKSVPNSSNVLMDLYVKVGYYNEEKDQRDFAHIIEHLAFRTSKHFSANLKSDLKRLKIKAGGTTSDISTAYSLSIPSSHMDTLDVGLLWFRDIADLELTEKTINIERGVVRQEQIFRVGYRLDDYILDSNLQSYLFPCKRNVSNFIVHIKNFPPQLLIEFYEKWYRTDRMGLVISGDIKNLDAMEDHIQKSFSDIPISKLPSPPDTNCESVYLQGPNRFIALERKQREKDVDKSMVKVYLFMRDNESLSHTCQPTAQLHRRMVWSSLITMINQRKQTNGAFLRPPEPSSPFYQIAIFDIDNREREKLEEIIKLIQQAKKYGFTHEEWKQTQNDILERIGDSKSPNYWKEQMFRHFVNDETLQENKFETLQKWVKGLSLEYINNCARKYLSVMPNDIGIIAPTGHKALSITEADVRSWINQVMEDTVKPYVLSEESVFKPLLSYEEIMDLKEVDYTSNDINDIGVEELKFHNGVKVVLHNYKSSESDNGQIRIHGFDPKGALCFSEIDYFSAINAPSIVKAAGLGNMNGKELQNFNLKNGVNPSLYINPLETGIKIDGNLGNIELILQLVYLYFSEPKSSDNNAFKIWRDMERKAYMYPYIDPRSLDFNVAMAEVLNDRSLVLLEGGIQRFKGIAQTDKIRAIRIYRQLYGNASDFTFIISGDFSREAVLPLIQKYLGNLADTIDVSCLDEGEGEIDLPKRPLYKEFLSGEMGISYRMEGSVHYLLTFTSKITNPHDWQERIKLVLLGRLINYKLNSFRFEKGGALYKFAAQGHFNRYLNTYNLGIYLDCTEEELEWIRKESKKMLLKIKKKGFSPEYYENIRDHVISVWYKSDPGQSPKPKEIYEYYRYKEPYIAKGEQERFIRSLTMEEIQETAKKYLNEENMMEFVMKDGDLK